MQLLEITSIDTIARKLKPPHSAQNAWRTLFVITLCVNFAFGLVIWAHGFTPENARQIIAGVLAVVSAAIAWKNGAQEAESDVRKKTRSMASLISLIALCSVILFAGIFHTNRIYLMASALLPIICVWAFFGYNRCKTLLPALFLSLFAMPDLPDEFRAHLFIPLQHICTFMAGKIAQLFVPLTFSGHMFTIDGSQLDVAPSCAGLGMWACFLFGFAIWQAFKSYKLPAYLAAFMLDPILVLLLNTVRIATTVIVAHCCSMRLALEIHSNLEFVLVPIGLLILWRVGENFARTK